LLRWDNYQNLKKEKMKKFLLIATLLAAASCTHHDQKIKLDLSFDAKKSAIGIDSSLELRVFDDRKNKEIIGQKEFGDEKINLTLDQNLVKFLQEKISEHLLEKGFKIGRDKSMEIHITAFKYKASRGFVIGKSDAKIAASVIVKNNKNGEELTKNFLLTLSGKHFIVPLASTDQEIINSLLQETIRDILEDSTLFESVAK